MKRKLFCVILSLAMIFSLTSVASAATPEEQTLVENTLTIEVAGNSEIGIAPMIWNQLSPTLASGGTYNGPNFSVTDYYIGYEATGTDANGNSCSGNYTVAIMRLSSVHSSMLCTANGGIYKMDWVSINPNTTYYFRIANNSTQTLKISVTYYTWST